MKVHLTRQNSPWSTLAERIPLVWWDRLRAWRWKLAQPFVRRWVTRKTSEIRWVFCVGCTNSGTTLLSQLLSEHPEIHGLPYEGDVITPALARPWDHGCSRVFSEQPEIFRLTETCRSVDPHQVGFDWLMARGSRPTRHLLIKSPTDMLRTRWLQAHFPNASFVAVVRNGFAVSEGIRRRERYDLSRAARHWSRAYQILLEDVAHLERFHCLRYEDLCECPQEALTSLAEFLEIDSVPLRKAGQGSAPWSVHNMHGQASAIQNFNLDSMKRLCDSEKDEIAEVAGSMLRHFGYLEPRLAS